MSEGISPVKSVIVADDHAIVRQGAIQILNDIEGTKVVAEADNGVTAIAAVKKHAPDLFVLDAAMPLARGVEVFGEARRWSPQTRIVLFTGFTSGSLLSAWLDTGVDGILLKSCPPDTIRECFVTVLNNGNYIAPEVAEIIKVSGVSQPLTQREREVMSLVVSGLTNVEIGERLFISVKTVEKHRGSLMGKLGVRSVADLMVAALKAGWLDEHKQL